MNPLAILKDIPRVTGGIDMVKEGTQKVKDVIRWTKNLVTGVSEIAQSVKGVALNEPRPISVSATDLTRLYRTNKIAFEADYKGRIALIKGDIASVVKANRSYDISLSTHNTMKLVCRIDKNHVADTTINRLRVGQAVTVLGVVKGKRVFFNTMRIEHCAVSE